MPTGTPRWRFTDASAGDLAVGGDPEVLAARRGAVVDHPWTWLRQAHDNTVVTVTLPGEHAGVQADGAVTDRPGAALAVHTADCGPVVLVGETGAGSPVLGVVHAGWRGLVAGIVPRTVEAMVRLGSGTPVAHVGPHIRVRCYEFGQADLDRVAGLVGIEVRSRTAWGAPALDLTAGISAALRAAGVAEVCDEGVCTACSPVHFSYRARADVGRQAAVAWLES